MFADFFRSIRTRIDAAIQSAALTAATAVAGLVGACFLLAALFTWIASQLGTLYTCLIFAGIFIAIAAITAIVAAVKRRRAEEKARAEQQRAAATAFMNPMILGPALQLFRSVGAKSSIVLLLGAIAAGWFLSQSHQDPRDDS